jgi:hypothetical protein
MPSFSSLRSSRFILLKVYQNLLATQAEASVQLGVFNFILYKVKQTQDSQNAFV